MKTPQVSLKMWAKRTNLHGFGELASSQKTWVKVMWVFFMASAFFLMALQIWRLGAQFAQGDTATRVKSTAIDDYPPSVVYCTSEVFNETKLEMENIDIYMLLDFLSIFFGKYKTDISAETLQKVEASRKSTEVFFRKYHFTSYDDAMEYLMRDPSSVFLITKQIGKITKIGTIGGPCYKVDFKKLSKSSYQMERFILPIIKRPLSKLMRDVLASTYSMDRYYQLQFGHRRVPLMINLNSDCVVTATRWNRIRKVDFPCRNADESPVDDIAFCETRCEDPLMRKCFGCIFYINTSRIAGESFCRMYSYEEQMLNNTAALCSANMLPVVERCLKSCQQRRACDEWNFDISAIPKQTKKLRDRNHDIRLLTVIINHPYSSAYYEEYYTYTLEQFISDLGGQLGLFFGASVLSIVQLCYFMCCSYAMDSRYFHTPNDSIEVSNNDTILAKLKQYKVKSERCKRFLREGKFSKTEKPTIINNCT